jgi:uncharacterized protein with gpF-like domain
MTQRPLHVEMSGKEYDLNNPPYIGSMYGNKIYGLPADLPNCRCVLRPIIDFDEE